VRHADWNHQSERDRRQRFDELFRRHAAGVASYCRWRSRSRGDAEDAVAEVFLICWRRLDAVPTGDRARPWLYATARRVLANQARAHERRGRLHDRLAEQQLAAAEEEQVDGRVRGALASLPPRDREVLLLAEWEGLSPGEIARVMRVAPVTVRVRLHRARRRFCSAYEAEPAARSMTTDPIRS
jgi:RNA polymerase sigma-70 factor (ECF subfamily)